MVIFETKLVGIYWERMGLHLRRAGRGHRPICFYLRTQQ